MNRPTEGPETEGPETGGPETGGPETEGPARVVTGHPTRWVALGVGVVLALLVAVLFTRTPGGESAASPVLGRLVPPVAGPTLSGDPYDIDDHRGEWVVVNFFASWCGPCRQEHPELVDFAADADRLDASVVSVAFDDTEADAREFFETLGGSWPVLVEGTAGVGVDFGVTGVPETYLVAPDGTVAARWVSQITATGLSDAIDDLSGRP